MARSGSATSALASPPSLIGYSPQFEEFTPYRRGHFRPPPARHRPPSGHRTTAIVTTSRPAIDLDRAPTPALPHWPPARRFCRPDLTAAATFRAIFWRPRAPFGMSDHPDPFPSHRRRDRYLGRPPPWPESTPAMVYCFPATDHFSARSRRLRRPTPLTTTADQLPSPRPTDRA